MFQIIEGAVAGAHGGLYADTLNKLTVAAKQEDGSFKGAGVLCDKPVQVLSFRTAAKALGFAIITRKNPENKTLVMRVSKEDAPQYRQQKKKRTTKKK